MKTRAGRPPNYEAICRAFPSIRGVRGVIFAYGDTVFVPAGYALPHHLAAHEQTHLRQQARAGGPEAWWERYITEPAFRLDQEIEAYRNQYRAMLPHERNAWLSKIVEDLSGEMYGRMIGWEEARDLITQSAVTAGARG